MEKTNQLDHTFETGLATIDEAQQISDLQQKNLRGNLSGDQQKDQGFLLLQFTKEEIQEYIQQKSIIVARHNGKVIGFRIADLGDIMQDKEIVEVLENSETIKAMNRPREDIKICKIRQACINEGYRGKNIPKLLYQAAQHEFGDRFNFGLGYINTNNKRSMHAHIDKLGFIPMNEFEIMDEKRLYILIPLKKNQELFNTLEEKK